MGSMENVKDKSTVYAINKIIDLLSSASVKRFINLTCWGEKLTADPDVKRSIQIIRGFLTDDTHPGAEEIYTFRSKYMDRYAANYGELADRVWKEEHLNMKEAGEGGPGA